MEIKDKTIALLIDSDNVSQAYFAILLDELSKYGRVTYRRLYGDFSKQNANGWKQALLEYSIEQRQQIAYTNGKNSTDTSMIIDAMDILYKSKVDCFCLATSDSDFTGLAMRFRNDNLVVIGAGEEKTPASFKKACDRFIRIDELLRAKKGMEKSGNESPANNKKNASQEKLVETAKKIIGDGIGADGWMHFSTFMNEIYRKQNEFNPKLYGHSNSSPSSFFKSISDTTGKSIFELEKRSSVDWIKISK